MMEHTEEKTVHRAAELMLQTERAVAVAHKQELLKAAETLLTADEQRLLASFRKWKNKQGRGRLKPGAMFRFQPEPLPAYDNILGVPVVVNHDLEAPTVVVGGHLFGPTPDMVVVGRCAQCGECFGGTFEELQAWQHACTEGAQHA